MSVRKYGVLAIIIAFKSTRPVLDAGHDMNMPGQPIHAEWSIRTA
jgi:hypothetical protein